MKLQVGIELEMSVVLIGVVNPSVRIEALVSGILIKIGDQGE